MLAPASDAILSNGVFHMLSGPAEMPAPAPTFVNAAEENFVKPEFETIAIAGLSVTMFLNEPFHTQVQSCRCRPPVCSFDNLYMI